VTGAYDNGTYGALERVGLHKPARPNLPRECFWRIVAPHAVLARARWSGRWRLKTTTGRGS
jgi:hypothetical protein